MRRWALDILEMLALFLFSLALIALLGRPHKGPFTDREMQEIHDSESARAANQRY